MTFSWESEDRARLLMVLATGAALGALMLAWLGLPPLDIHSPLHFLGIMDPLCGMTRAARALALGDLATAWLYNPGIFLLSAGAGLVLGRALFGLVTGRWISVILMWRRGVLIAGVGFFLALWVRQQLHAELLMQFGMSGSG